MSEKWIELAEKQQAEIDRLNGVITEWERDMNGTLRTLEAERQNGTRLLEAREDALKTAEVERHPFRPWHDKARAAIAEATGRAA
ncbi:MAG: hypothetical protein U0835_00385 [Isosphaeraceae bacterium]